MAEFIAAIWNPQPQARPPEILDLTAKASKQGWTEILSRPGLCVLGQGRGGLLIQQPTHGRLILLGHWTSERSLLDVTARDVRPLSLCRRLTEGGWGRYVALTVNELGAVDGVYRDPSGALDCMIWSQADVTMIASTAAPWLFARGDAQWAPDWDRVADMVADPTLISGPSALTGVTAVTPGDFQPLPRTDRSPVAVWRPSDFVGDRTIPVEEARHALAGAIDRVVGHYVEHASHSLVEVSGGLDSAIVAAALHAASDSHPQTLVNYYGPYAEADERIFARAVAEGVGRPLTTIARESPIDVASGWMEDRLSFRPGVNRLDPIYDASQAILCRALDHPSIITGKGGDSVLFQPNTPLVFADVLQARGAAALIDPRLFEVARWTRSSIWAVLNMAGSGLRQARQTEQAAGRAAPAFARQGMAPARPHPWLDDLAGVPPAKRMQIAAIASNLTMHGPSLQTDVAEVFHPMLTQPVLEQALRTPTIDLVEGGRDRGLARMAFRGRIPESIRLRRTKGGLSRYFGLAIAHELDRLRPFLLDGLLSQHGLLDRVALDAALSRDALIWKGLYGDIMLLAVTEAWARRWDDLAGGL